MKRLYFIGLFVILIVATIFIWSKSYYSSHEEATVLLPFNASSAVIPSEEGTFIRSMYANDYADMNANLKAGRTLKEYYSNRAYHGAPPYIPHPVKEEMDVGGKSCLKCHENGGFVSKYDAFTPVVPHPEKTNCRQCHVVQLDKGLFKSFEERPYFTPPIGNSAFEGGPPIIPHQIQLHENCLACHAGPAAPEEIRVSHPERSNCRQCHVLNNKEMTDIGNFRR